MDNNHSVKRMAASATLHCRAGCAVVELIVVTIGTIAGFAPHLTVLLAAAFVAAYPVNLYLLRHGKGHALTHEYMHM